MKFILNLVLILALAYAIEGQALGCPRGSFLTYTGDCWPCIYVLPNCLACTGPTECTECMEGTRLVNGECVEIEEPLERPGECPAGFFLDATGSCIRCSTVMPNCVLCDSAANCLKCAEGTRLVNGKCVAIVTTPIEVCPSGQYYSDDLNTCLDCGEAITGCVRCENASMCLECKPELKLYNGICYTVQPRPRCPPGEFLDDVAGICVRCSTLIPNCLECLNSTTCAKCTNNTRLVNGRCVAIPIAECPVGTFKDPITDECMNCCCKLQYCLECANATVCTKCMPGTDLINGKCIMPGVGCGAGQFLNPLTGECRDCNKTLVNCLECANATHCTLCTDNTVLIRGVCVPAGEIACEPGEYFDDGLNRCVDCSLALPNCLACIDANTCTLCAAGYELVNGACVLVPVECPEGFFRSLETGECVLCSSFLPNCVRCNNASWCIECDEGSALINGECVPILFLATGRCPNGTFYYPDLGGCIDCSIILANCTSCANATTCLTCAPGTVLINGVCIPENLIVCPVGFYQDPITKRCRDCSEAIPNCTLCLNATYCYRCDGPNWAVDGECIPIAEVPCMPGFYRDPISLTCLPCQSAMPFCARCNSPDFCLQCSPGYVAVNGKCQRIPRRRLRNLQNMWCKSGQYLKFGKCHKCPKECKTCKYENEQVICTDCIPGYYLEEGNCTMVKF